MIPSVCPQGTSPAFAPVPSPSPKSAPSTESSPGPGMTIVKVTGTPGDTGFGPAVTLAVNRWFVVVVVAGRVVLVDVRVVAGGAFVVETAAFPRCTQRRRDRHPARCGHNDRVPLHDTPIKRCGQEGSNVGDDQGNGGGSARLSDR